MRHIRFDIKRLTLGELVIAVASAALMIGIGLPWFRFGSGVAGYFSFNAVELRSWMYVPFCVAAAIVVSVILSATRRRPRLPVVQWLAVIGACSADLVATVVCFVKKSPGLDWDFGAYVSISAAIVALMGALVSRRRAKAVAANRASMEFEEAGRRARPLVPVSPRQARDPRPPRPGS